MGILNLTPDSFSDGGNYMDPNLAVEKALQMVNEGAQIIDLGGESTRPGSDPVSEKEEINRVIPIIEKLPLDKFVISIDTTKAEVAKLALELGVHIINDVSGGNEKLLNLAQKHKSGFILMHAQGRPKDNAESTILHESSFVKSVLFLTIKKSYYSLSIFPRVWIDPGIGFGKTLSHNLELMKNLDSFKDQTWGVMLDPPENHGLITLRSTRPDQKNGGLDRFRS